MAKGLTDGGLILTSKPISDVVVAARNILGDYNVNPENYLEMFNLMGMGIYGFIGLNMNGVLYTNNSPFVSYDKDTGTLTLRGLKTDPLRDLLSVVFNRVDPVGTQVQAYNVPVAISDGAKVNVKGDYDISPDGYSESYDISDFGIEELVGINVNTAFYTHPKQVAYNPATKYLTVFGLKLVADDQICLVFTKRK